MTELEKKLGEKYSLEVTGLEAVILKQIITDAMNQSNNKSEPCIITISDGKGICMVKMNSNTQLRNVKKSLRKATDEVEDDMLDLPNNTTLNVVLNDSIPTIVGDVDFHNFCTTAKKKLEYFEKYKK